MPVSKWYLLGVAKAIQPSLVRRAVGRGVDPNALCGYYNNRPGGVNSKPPAPAVRKNAGCRRAVQQSGKILGERSLGRWPKGLIGGPVHGSIKKDNVPKKESA
jgi:hypothetical protein